MKFVATILLLLAALGLQAKDVNELQDAEPAGLIKIEVLRGEIQIEGWDRLQIQVKGDLDDLAEGLRFEVKAGVAEIEVQMPRADVNWGDGSDLVVYVPKLSRMAVDSVSTDIEVSGVHGHLQLRSISGEIEVKEGRDRINLKTVSGNIDTTDTVGKLLANSTSGDIEVGHHRGDLDIETMSGEVEVEARDVNRLRGSTVSGSLAVEASLTPGAIAELTSVSGKISVQFEKPLDIELRASTTSGNIENDLNDAKTTEGFGMESLQTRIGQGSSSVTVRTVSGAIELEEG